MEPAPILRPLGYRDLFDESFDLLKRNFLVFFGISAIACVPIHLLMAHLELLVSGAASGGPGELGGLILAVVAAVSLYLLMIFAMYLAQAALLSAVADSYLGQPVSIADAYRSVVRRFFPLFFTMLLGGLVAISGLLVFVVGVIYTALAMAFVTPVFIVEGKRYADAIGRSWTLAAGERRRIAVVSFLAGFIGGAVQAILVGFWYGALTALGADTEQTTPLIATGTGLINGLSTALSLALQTIPLLLLYFDVRVRKEGFDIELLSQGMGEVPASTWPA